MALYEALLTAIDLFLAIILLAVICTDDTLISRFHVGYGRVWDLIKVNVEVRFSQTTSLRYSWPNRGGNHSLKLGTGL